MKALRIAVFECADALTKCFNSYIVGNSSFPDELKLADIIPLHKKGSTSDKANYRPISLLPTVSKVFERLIAKQIRPFLDSRFSKYLCGFRKGHNPSYAILNMTRKWYACLNTSGRVGAILMDLSKAFDCLPHDLLIAKMAAYGFGKRSLKLFLNYLSNRKHRVRIGSSISELLELLLGVPQGSVLGPILFNIFINDLLFSVTESEICNFADDNTLYVCGHDIDHVLQCLQSDLGNIMKWFCSNGMVANPDKFKAIFPGTENQIINVQVESLVIESSKEVTLLGVTLDTQMTFYPYIKSICKKASTKAKALIRIRGYLTQQQADHLYNAYIMSCFNYCPLVWMFCSKQAHSLINITHFKALCARFNIFSESFDQLLLRSNTSSIHTRNLNLMVIEIFKSLNCLNPKIMWNTFEVKPSSYNLRQGQSLLIPVAKTVRALNSFDLRASLAWNYLPKTLKAETSLSKFKASLRLCKIYCRCRLCIY